MPRQSRLLSSVAMSMLRAANWRQLHWAKKSIRYSQPSCRAYLKPLLPLGWKPHSTRLPPASRTGVTICVGSGRRYRPYLGTSYNGNTGAICAIQWWSCRHCNYAKPYETYKIRQDSPEGLGSHVHACQQRIWCMSKVWKSTGQTQRTSWRILRMYRLSKVPVYTCVRLMIKEMDNTAMSLLF